MSNYDENDTFVPEQESAAAYDAIRLQRSSFAQKLRCMIVQNLVEYTHIKWDSFDLPAPQNLGNQEGINKHGDRLYPHQCDSTVVWIVVPADPAETWYRIVSPQVPAEFYQ